MRYLKGIEMVTAIIIDDEQKNVSMLISMLQKYCPQVTLLGTANDITTGKKLIIDLKPQLIFLDIEMPNGSGFDLLISLPDLKAEIIFITAHDHYAINAFRYAAIDYLLKPVDIEQLEHAVMKAAERISEKISYRNYEMLLRNLEEKETGKQSLLLTDKGQQYFIAFPGILYLIADGSYVHIHTSQKVFVTAKSLKDFEQMLPGSIFQRIHHGHIINIKHIAKIEKGRGGMVCMSDGRSLEISVRRKEQFMKQIVT